MKEKKSTKKVKEKYVKPSITFLNKIPRMITGGGSPLGGNPCS